MTKSGVITKVNKAAGITEAIRLLTSRCVKVGIPAGPARDDAEGEGLTNAQIGYIHENGSPKRNIPARPFLLPGIRVAQKQIVAMLEDAGKQALEGKAQGVAKALDAAGKVATNSVRAQFVENDWPELAEGTLKKRPKAQRDESGKIIRRGKSREEKGRTNPLLDTNQLRDSITYVVEKR
ncbi:MAG: hypothetical protein AB7D51_01735 [Desulfovibrionaceae bacterium]